MPRHVRRFAVVASLALAVAAACSPQNETAGPTASVEPAAADASSFQGAAWTVSEIEGEPTLATVKPSLTFSPDGRVSGSGSCNSYGGPYTVTAEGLSIGPAAATRRACLDAATTGQEQRFFDAFGRVTRFKIGADGTLALLGADGAVLIRASR